jgi:6-phosphogluconolactonase
MLNRRELLAGAACVTSTALGAAKKFGVYFGTYTRGPSKGIYWSEFDSGSGALSEPLLAAEAVNPSFLTLSPDRRYLFAVSEVADAQGKPTGAVTSFLREPRSGRLTALNSVSSEGAWPCYVSTAAKGRYVLVANYGGGTIAALPVGADGKLQPASSTVAFTGSGANPKRQEKPHAHCIKPSPDGRHVLAADLGTDRVMIFTLVGGVLKANQPPHAAIDPGAGPRHFTFHPRRPVLYVINELASTVTAFRWNAEKGSADPIKTVPTLPEGFSGSNTTAEIVVHPEGRFLFGSNRGHDSIATFRLDGDGMPHPAGHAPTGGKTPRNFALDPTGRFLLAANQATDNVLVMRLNTANGSLEPAGIEVKVGSPVCVCFDPTAL